MRIKDGTMIAIRNLKKRRGRTILTALGVAIGTSAIVSMLALGLGLQQNAQDSLGDFGDLSVLEIYPDWQNAPPGEEAKIEASQIEMLEQLEGVQAVMPYASYYGPMDISMGRQQNWANIQGIDFSKAQAFGMELVEGRLPDGSKREVLASYLFPEQFFEEARTRPDRDNPSPEGPGGNNYVEQMPTPGRLPVVGRQINLSQEQYLGENEIKIKENKVTVTGILSESAGGYGSTIYLPLEMVAEMNDWYQGSDEGRSGGRRKRGDQEVAYEQVKVKVINNDMVPQVVEGVRASGLDTWSPTDMLDEINQVFLVIQLILGGIGSVALLVATIGIVNTMTMSILERNKEIGVMKVVGATIPNIKYMFLTESAIIGILGGGAGLLTSYGLVGIVNLVGKNVPGLGASSSLATIPWWLALFALVFSLVVGLLAGLYPASKAAAISPLEAIRND